MPYTAHFAVIVGFGIPMRVPEPTCLDNFHMDNWMGSIFWERG